MLNSKSSAAYMQRHLERPSIGSHWRQFFHVRHSLRLSIRINMEALPLNLFSPSAAPFDVYFG